jgi:hypothetical protein
MSDPVNAYLVPTPAGAAFALASRLHDPRRNVLSGLLRGAASRPTPLALLTDLAAVPDRKSLGVLLYKMQRDGWLSGDVEPLLLPDAPLNESLPLLLGKLSATGKAVLSDESGICFAFSGYSAEDAARLAAFSAGLRPMAIRYSGDQDGDAVIIRVSAQPGDSEESALSVFSLHIGKYTFILTLAGTAHAGSVAFVHMAGLLSRRYLGTC